MGGVRDWEYQSHPIFENQVKIKQSIESMSAIFFSRLGKRGDSLLSCASDFLPITVFVSIGRIN